MKQLFTLLFGLFYTFSSSAQSRAFGPISVETWFNIAKVGFNNFQQGLRFKYFFGGTADYYCCDDQLRRETAVRLGVNALYGKNKNTFQDPVGTEFGSNEIESLSVYLSAGLEHHFPGGKRISPYAGAEVLFGTADRDEEAMNSSDGANFQKDYRRKVAGDLGFIFGGKIVLGLDCYLFDHFYLGLEVGAGYTSARYGDKTISIIPPQGFPPPPPDTVPGDADNTAGPALFNSVRLGYRF